MPTRLALRVLVLLLVLVVLPLALVRGGGPATSEYLAFTVAPRWNMSCSLDGAWYCSDVQGLPRYATFNPASGPVTDLSNRSDDVDQAPGMEQYSQDTMIDFHGAACVDSSGVQGFVKSVAALSSPGSVGPQTVGNCTMTGGFIQDLRAVGYHWVTSRVLPPPPSTPTPVPPTPPPVVTPTPTPTATPTPSPTPTVSPSPTPTPTPSLTPTASPTRTPRPSATPEQTVAGITFAPEPSLRPPDIAGDPTGWAASVHDPADVSTDPAAMGVSALLAVVLLLFMGFVGELFNNTVKAHYDEISGWWQKGLIGRVAAAWSAMWKSGP